MASIQVSNHLDDLARDTLRIATTARAGMTRIVKRNVKDGERLARRIAQERSGPHGKNYFKRITSEMTSPLSGEFGPHGRVDNNAVGAGWRHGTNTDLARAGDVAGAKLAKDAGDFADGLFWRG